MRCRILLCAFMGFSPASGWASCDSTNSGANNPGYLQALMPCSVDSDCRAHPMYEDVVRTEGLFPPVCINGMCQVVTTHRCETDEDCVDVYNGRFDPSLCVTHSEAPHDRLCETERISAPFAGDEHILGVQCHDCCFPQGDPDTSKYSCPDFICYAVANPGPVWARLCPMTAEDDGFHIGGCSVGLP